MNAQISYSSVFKRYNINHTKWKRKNIKLSKNKNEVKKARAN